MIRFDVQELVFHYTGLSRGGGQTDSDGMPVTLGTVRSKRIVEKVVRRKPARPAKEPRGIAAE